MKIVYIIFKEIIKCLSSLRQLPGCAKRFATILLRVLLRMRLQRLNLWVIGIVEITRNKYSSGFHIVVQIKFKDSPFYI